MKKEIKTRQLTSIEEAVLNCIPQKKPVLKEDIVSRKDIGRIVGLKPREVSNVIERLREDYPICSSRGKCGYWIGNKEDALKFAEECRHHAEGLQKTAMNIEEMFAEDLIPDVE